MQKFSIVALLALSPILVFGQTTLQDIVAKTSEAKLAINSGTARFSSMITMKRSQQFIDDLQKDDPSTPPAKPTETFALLQDVEWSGTVWRATSSKAAEALNMRTGETSLFDVLDFYDGKTLYDIVRKADEPSFIPAGSIQEPKTLMWRTPIEVLYSACHVDLSKFLNEGRQHVITSGKSGAFGPTVVVSMISSGGGSVTITLAPERSWAVVDCVADNGKYGRLHQYVDKFQAVGGCWIPSRTVYEISGGKDPKNPAYVRSEVVQFDDVHLGPLPAPLTLGGDPGTLLTDKETQRIFKIGTDGTLVPIGYSAARQLSKSMGGRMLIVVGTAGFVGASCLTLALAIRKRATR